MTLQPLRADKLSITHTAHIQEEVLSDVSSESGHLGCSMVTEVAGEGTLGSVDQEVALPLELVLKASITGGTVVKELSEALTSF